MTMSDPISDMLTRIRNSLLRYKRDVMIPSSKLKVAIAGILKQEGYIREYISENYDNNKSKIKIELKYNEGQPVIKKIKRISKPGIRVYSKISKMPKPYGGLGISILSTPKGVMTDSMARNKNVGGEILCQVF